jgi:P-type Ca2+ transporter type 2C
LQPAKGENRAAKPRVAPVHAVVPGRARLEVAGLYRNAALAPVLEGWLRRRSGIVSVAASPLTGKVLVRFDPELDLEQVRACLEDALAAAERRGGRVLKAGDGRDADLNSLVSLPQSDGPTWHRLPAPKAASLLDTSAQSGLSQAAAVERLERFGPNRLPAATQRSGLEILTEQFNSLPVALLGVSAALALVTGGLLEAVAIGCVVGLNAAIGYATESEAERTINALTDDASPPATVIRSGRRRQIPVEAVVPGDLLELTPGTAIPADARLIVADRLSVDESALTGESLPAAKRIATLRSKRLPIAERSNLVFKGTTVAGGNGRAVVVAAGVTPSSVWSAPWSGRRAPRPRPCNGSWKGSVASWSCFPWASAASCSRSVCCAAMASGL